MKTIKGDLINLAKEGRFDVIAHGCNCQGIMSAGIAKQMAQEFGADRFPMEVRSRIGYNISKLGNIDYYPIFRRTFKEVTTYLATALKPETREKLCILINCYTQFNPGKGLDLDALRLCLKKINHIFRQKHIGLPKIGCGIAGGNWKEVKQIIKEELYSMEVTIVEYEKE
jgi:O-acetyl-ADP-ribose deacetylase (regulator of RNase III)